MITYQYGNLQSLNLRNSCCCEHTAPRPRGSPDPAPYAPVHTGPNSHWCTRQVGHSKASPRLAQLTRSPNRSTHRSSCQAPGLSWELRRQCGARRGGGQLSPQTMVCSGTCPLPPTWGVARVGRLSSAPKMTGVQRGPQPLETIYGRRAVPRTPRLPARSPRHPRERGRQAGNRQEEHLQHPRHEPELPRAEALCGGRAMGSRDHCSRATAPQHAAQDAGEPGGTRAACSCRSRTLSNPLSCLREEVVADVWGKEQGSF